MAVQALDAQERHLEFKAKLLHGVRWCLGYIDVLFPAAILLLIAGACFLWPMIGHVQSPTRGSLNGVNLPPLSPGHLLGTDSTGGDLFSRALYGGRLSMEVGLGSVAIGFAVGGVLGVAAGYFGGLTDTLVMRILDMLLSFPSLVLALAVASYLGPSEPNVIYAIGFFTVPAYGRLSRSAVLRLRELTFITAARLDARSSVSIIARHIVPNVVPQMMTFGLIMVAIAMIIESALSFLGLGVPPPQPSWGGMIAAGQSYLGSEPWIVLVPSCFLFVTVLNLNILGDAIRERIR